MRFEDLRLNMHAEHAHTVTERDVVRFAEVTGDRNPLHLDEAVAARSRFGTRVAHGMLLAGFISALLGTELPGPGSVYVAQTLRFNKPVKLGDTVITRVEVAALVPERRRATFATTCRNQHGETVVEGEATLLLLEDSG
jgi:3-hydroxybutyryl-CoA dehydratase